MPNVSLNEREKRLIIALVIVTGAFESLKQRVEQLTGGDTVIVAKHPNGKALLPFALSVDALKACFGDDPTVAAKLYHEVENNWTDWPASAVVDLPEELGGEHHHVH